MADRTGIEWTDATWNPVTGCTEVSPGCDHCYARTFAERWRGVPGHHFERGFDLTLRPERLDQPLKWKRSRRIFVNSMSDLFHADVPDEFIAKVFVIMALAREHTFQVLTKRPARMRALLSSGERWRELLREADSWSCFLDLPLPVQRFLAVRRWIYGTGVYTDPVAALPNVWLGVSVENQQWADIRIPVLLDTPARTRWLSCEPLLGPLDLSGWLGTERACPGVEMPPGSVPPRGHTFDCCSPGLIDWVVAGGESGPGARTMRPAWARSLRDQCRVAGVPFLFKQWGGPNKKATGRVLDGRAWDQYPPTVGGRG